MTEVLAADSRGYFSRAVEGLVRGGWSLKSIPESGRLAPNKGQRIRLDSGPRRLETRLFMYAVGDTGRGRPSERRIEITSTYENTAKIRGVQDVVLGVDRATGVLVGFDPRRMDKGGETHNATSFFDQKGLGLARRGPLAQLARPSQLFGTEYHAFFEPHLLAEYLFNLGAIHAGTYGGGGAFASVTRKQGAIALKAPAGARGGDTVVVSRRAAPPKPRKAKAADVMSYEAGESPKAPLTPEEFEAIRRRGEENGELGEAEALEYERRRLKSAKRTDLAAKVKWVSKDDVRLGYDIRSYETDGSDRFVEVKSTQGTGKSFHISRNEVRAAEKHGKNYVILRLTKVRDRPAIEEIRDPAQLVADGGAALEPTVYRLKR